MLCVARLWVTQWVTKSMTQSETTCNRLRQKYIQDIVFSDFVPNTLQREETKRNQVAPDS